ncbi:hypothetical protein NKJ26_29990 [Mesorhizobium sp. M0152]|uniref:hypothetical protein n=1 Tax=Mesorhizobium sp. M0152 TaxID=2956898 RepID=UPI003335027F
MNSLRQRYSKICACESALRLQSEWAELVTKHSPYCMWGRQNSPDAGDDWTKSRSIVRRLMKSSGGTSMSASRKAGPFRDTNVTGTA